MCVLGKEGDTKLLWNKKNKDEVENARRTFDKFVKEKRFVAFSISKMGRKSKKVTEFDPNIQKLIFVPPIAGGAMDYTTECAPPSYQGQLVDVKQPYKTNDEAEIKAMLLLKKKIGEKQFIKLVATDHFEIKGKYGTYALNWGSILLQRFDKIGKKTRPLIYTLCINTSPKIGYLPKGDKLLSLYLDITENEDKFIETANFRNVQTTDEFHERGEVVR